MAVSLPIARCKPTDHELVWATCQSGSNTLTLLPMLAASGYVAVDGMHSVVTLDEQKGGGTMRELSRRSTGHDSPGRTRRPVVAFWFSVTVTPGLAPNRLVKTVLFS